MTALADVGPGEREPLLTFLSHQRRAALAVLADLGEDDLRRSVVPSGWTPLGLLEHLASAERFWGQWVLTARVADRPWADAPGAAWTAHGHGTDEVVAFYRDSCDRTDANLAALRDDALPDHVDRDDLPTAVGSVREVVLHLVEETARHVGHLDIARELLDGRTGLGPR